MEVKTIDFDDVKIGEIVPIFGYISNIETIDGKTSVRLNGGSIVLSLHDQEDSEKIALLRQQAFEAGIFISRVDRVEENTLFATVGAIIFGRQHPVSVQ